MYFEEVMKMRNLFEEFNCFCGIWKFMILGVREYVFMGFVLFLVWFMFV